MPKKDIYHDVVKNALIKDGRTITHDPFILSVGFRHMAITEDTHEGIFSEPMGQIVVADGKVNLIVLGFHPPEIRKHTGYAVA